MKVIEDVKYYTVKEFAEAADISDKAVYQQLKTRLKEYSKSIDGVTMITHEALEAFYLGTQGTQVKSSQVDLKLKSSLELDRYISFLESEIREYKEQLKEKDNTIKELNQQIINLSKDIAAQSSESLKQISSITKNIQLLQVAEAREDIINSQETEIVEQPKKSFFDRLRGK